MMVAILDNDNGDDDDVSDDVGDDNAAMGDGRRVEDLSQTRQMGGKSQQQRAANLSFIFSWTDNQRC